MNDRLILHVKHFEAFRSRPYLCPAGYPTIGYGHRIPSMDHRPIDEMEATGWLLADLSAAQRQALTLCPALSGARLDALTDLVFNVGLGALDGDKPDDPIDDAGVVQALRRGDWPDAATRFRQWCNARNPKTKQLEPLPGLVARRAVGAAWIEQG
ncbi:MAG TPA: lysozyme [Phycisphaerales bacterium]|nr:lysozyme [Phycisphaerales bacterium]